MNACGDVRPRNNQAIMTTNSTVYSSARASTLVGNQAAPSSKET